MIQITENKLKRLMRRCYHYGLNEGWRFEEFIEEKLKELKK